MRLRGWVLVAWAVGVASGAYGQFAEDVTVTGSRLPAVPVRRVVVLSQEEIAVLPVRSLEDLLRLVAGTGIARRGPFGVQADASLRGTTFEGVLVLVNGVRVNDPQTGHFHLEVPVPLESVEKIEVLTGPASALFGAGAAGGVIAITTKNPQQTAASFLAGSHSLSGFSLSVPWKENVGFSFSRQESAGFRPDADFMSNQASLTGSWSPKGWKGQWLLSAGSKQFGAWTFYSSRFPHQRERTTTGLFTADIERELSQTVKLQLHAGLRQHRDVYLLEKHRPSWYRNRHRTRFGDSLPHPYRFPGSVLLGVGGGCGTRLPCLVAPGQPQPQPRSFLRGSIAEPGSPHLPPASSPGMVLLAKALFPSSGRYLLFAPRGLVDSFWRELFPFALVYRALLRLAQLSGGPPVATRAGVDLGNLAFGSPCGWISAPFGLPPGKP